MSVQDAPLNGNQAANELDINTDENMNGNTHLNEPVAQENELEKLREELEAMKDKYIRQAAEFDNYRKRTSKERQELVLTAGKDVISSLLVVLDDCDRAEKQLEKAADLAAMKEGLNLVFGKLRNTLTARGLKAMESKGADFDPDQHEAITEIPAPSPEWAGKVVDEVEKGYLLNDKIIRFAKVVVGK